MSDTFIKFHNTIIDYEKNSTKYISPENYFVVNCSFGAEISSDEFVKKQLAPQQSNVYSFAIPSLLCGYAGIDRVAFIFSPSESVFLGGDHQKITSYFTSKCALYFNMEVVCNIVELSTQPKVLAYLQHLIFKSHKFYDKIGKYVKYLPKQNEFSYLEEIPNMREIEQHKKFFFT